MRNVPRRRTIGVLLAAAALTVTVGAAVDREPLTVEARAESATAGETTVALSPTGQAQLAYVHAVSRHRFLEAVAAAEDAARLAEQEAAREQSRAAAAAVPSASPAPSGGTGWDAVAACESGSDWSIDSGNGYRGGLQWTQETWDTYRAPGTPANAAEATREQEIDAASRAPRSSWPNC